MPWASRVLSLLFCVLLLPSCDRSEAENLAPNPSPPAEVGRAFKVIHVYVALCDNASQGIAPVPAKIGNGDDPANNLYWGCTDGARAYFSQSKRWKRLSVTKVKGQSEILERLIFQHKRTGAIMVVDAWKGSSIKTTLQEFCQSCAGQKYESLELKIDGESHRINIAGGADFLTFIGHNGLMEFSLTALDANPHRKQNVDIAVLCCQSHRFFAKHTGSAKVRPVVMTQSNMYPGAFILHDVLEGWFAQESLNKLRIRAAKAYAKNQSISIKSALHVFAPLP